ncbi:HNH endonuclease signature motif containing protein [Calidifontibacter terrae]
MSIEVTRTAAEKPVSSSSSRSSSRSFAGGFRPLDVAELLGPDGSSGPAGSAGSDVRLLDAGSGPSALNRLQDALPDLPVLADGCSQLSDTELTEAARLAAVFMQRAEAALMLITADAIDRGAITRSTANSPGTWVARIAAGEGPADLITSEAIKNAGPLVPLSEDRASADCAGQGNTHTETEPVAPAAFRVPGIEPGHANRIAKVAAASLHVSHRVMAAAVRDGAASISVARAALDHVNRIKTVLPNATTDEIHAWFLAVPATLGRSGVTELSKRIIADYGTRDALNDKEAEQQRLEFLRYRDENDGMTSIEGLLSGDNAAEFKHLINALSAPSPKTSCCDDPHHRHTSTSARGSDEASSSGSAEAGSDNLDRDSGEASDEEESDSLFDQRAKLIRLADDDRSPDKRRIDALMMMLRRVAAWLDGDPTVATSGPAQMVVTIDYETLAQKLRDTGGGGSGTNREGATISPGAARRMACDATLIPMVLGTNSEPLDAARAQRLYTGALRHAVLQKHGNKCTYQGCTRPGDWTEIHHAIHWADGGPTNLDNGYPLCGADHAIVHRDNLTPTTTSTGKILWIPRLVAAVS